jgi:molecular chaperone DnaK (HSP70)
MDSSSECFIFFTLIVVLLAASVQHMIPSPPVTAVGIDLGTTFSCIAAFNDGEVDVIVNAEGSTITPSVLFVPSNGSDIIVGEHARSAAARQPGTLLYDAKRFVGKRYNMARLAEEVAGLPFDIVPRRPARDPTRMLEPHLLARRDGGQPLTFSPEEVGAHIVRRLRAAAEKKIGQQVRLAVLAVPVGFAKPQIEATRQAAILAGFEVMRIIHEPTAAAMAYGLHEVSCGRRILVA